MNLPMCFHLTIHFSNGKVLSIENAQNCTAFQNMSSQRNVLERIFEHPRILLENGPYASFMVSRDEINYVHLTR